MTERGEAGKNKGSFDSQSNQQKLFILRVKHSLPYYVNHLQELRVKQHRSRNGLPEIITRYDFHMLEALMVQHSS